MVKLDKTLTFIKQALNDIELTLEDGVIDADFEVQLETLLTAVKEMVDILKREYIYQFYSK